MSVQYIIMKTFYKKYFDKTCLIPRPLSHPWKQLFFSKGTTPHQLFPYCLCWEWFRSIPGFFPPVYSPWWCGQGQTINISLRKHPGHVPVGPSTEAAPTGWDRAGAGIKRETVYILFFPPFSLVLQYRFLQGNKSLKHWTYFCLEKHFFYKKICFYRAEFFVWM